MKTIVTGTLEEWMSFNPKAMLINRKINFMSSGCYVQFPFKLLDPIETVYHSNNHLPDTNTGYAHPFYHSGKGVVLTRIKAKHRHFVSVGTIYGTGSPIYPIAEVHWNDPNWEEIEKVEDCYKN